MLCSVNIRVEMALSIQQQLHEECIELSCARAGVSPSQNTPLSSMPNLSNVYDSALGAERDSALSLSGKPGMLQWLWGNSSIG